MSRVSAQAQVGVFAPSSPFGDDRYAQGLDALRDLGLQIHEPDGLRSRTGYLAGSDEHRIAQIHALLDDPTVEILWAARGGYGLHRIVDRIDPERLRQGKPIVGFSDITALHALMAHHGLMSVHGPVITQLGDIPEVGAQVLDVLMGRWDNLRYEADGPAICAGVAEGRLVGGNLSVLAPMVGSPIWPDLDGTILLLEDVGEATYRIDRLLTGLRLSGVLNGVRGVALGEFTGCRPRNDHEPEVIDVLRDRLSDLNIPILAGLPFGHGERNLAIPLGARACLDADTGCLVIDGP